MWLNIDRGLEIGSKKTRSYLAFKINKNLSTFDEKNSRKRKIN